MRRILILGAATLAALSLSPRDALGQWSDLGLSGRAIGTLRSADGWLYACTDNGLYRKASDTADSSWALLGFSGQHVYDLLAVTADTLIAARQILGADTLAMLRSTDGGASWTGFQNGFGDDNGNQDHRERVLLAFPGSPGTLIALSPSRAARSTNGGVTWKTVVAGYPDLRFASAGIGSVWVGGGSGIFTPIAKRSFDGGATWTTGYFSGNDATAIAVGFHPTDPNTAFLAVDGALYKTTTAGSPWTLVKGSPTWPNWINALASRSSTPLRLYAAGYPVINGPTFYSSDDDGASWARVSFVYPRGGVANTLLVRSAPGADSIVLGTDNGVVRYLETALVAVDPVAEVSRLALRATPNVTRDATLLSFDLPQSGHVALDVLDLAGRRVATLAEGERPSGPHRVPWDVTGLRSGVYLCRLRANGEARIAKVFVVR